MHRTSGFSLPLYVLVLAVLACGCAASVTDSDFEDDPGMTPGDGDSTDDPPGGDGDGDTTGGDGDTTTTGGGGTTTGGDGDGDPDGDPPPRRDGFVYAHSNRQLYRIATDTLEIEPVGSIRFSDGINQMTDLAIDREGRMIGISFREVYSVDPDTAEATLLATLDRAFNGLSFVPRGQGETLVGTALDGTVWEVNPETGVTTELGAFGNDIGSSGDVVGVFDLGTLATARRDDWSSDHLVRVDPQTGVATDIAELGVTNVWGLGFWNDRLFGFAETGEFIVIDAVTGETELVENTGIAWWGAAVTTDAPVIVELR